MIEKRHGWEFVNKTDCLDYIESHGQLYNLHTCPLGQDTRATCHSDSDHVSGCCPCCPPVWDGFLCWPPALPDALVKQPCPANIAQLNHKSEFIFLTVKPQLSRRVLSVSIRDYTIVTMISTRRFCIP